MVIRLKDYGRNQKKVKNIFIKRTFIIKSGCEQGKA